MLELETEREDSWLSREMEARGVRLSFLTDYQQRPGGGPPSTLW